jgi:hypothetical protein
MTAYEALQDTAQVGNSARNLTILNCAFVGNNIDLIEFFTSLFSSESIFVVEIAKKSINFTSKVATQAGSLCLVVQVIVITPLNFRHFSRRRRRQGCQMC